MPNNRVDVAQVFQHNSMSEEVTKKRYLTYFEYFATGEGHTIELYMIIASNEAEAKQKHLDASYSSDLDAQAYFGEGINVVELESGTGKEIIFALFKEPESLYESLIRGGRDFHFKLYYNLS